MSSRLLRQIDRLRGTALARRLQSSALLTRMYHASRAALFRERATFAWKTLTQTPGVRTYTLREGGTVVAMRHDVPDVIVIDEIFWWGFYEPPEAVVTLLGPAGPASVADLGANIGAFGAWCLRRWPGAEIIGVEPDPDNARVCERAISANRAGDRWRLVEACAGTEPGSVLFAAGQGAQSTVVDAPGPGVLEIEQVDAFELIEPCDVVKIDIESAEWPLLADPRMEQLRADAVLLEYHPHGAPSGDPHGDARRLLNAAGYDQYSVERMPEDHGIAWAWRSAARR